MINFKKNKIKHPRMKRHIIGLALIWTIIIATGLFWSIKHEKENTIELAKIQARIAFEKDVIYRRWNTMHGGVYVPVTEYTQPNPYMSNIPDRDITTSSNKSLIFPNKTLTLMNPDYMMRQVDELAIKEFGVLGHITSLNPTREENAADPWEAKALNAFEKGETEFSAVRFIDGVEHMRLIRPLITEEGCMQCHAKQVYQVGDIRGGLSVAVPMEDLRSIELAHLIKYFLAHIFLWILGLTVIIVIGKRLLRDDFNRKLTEERLALQHSEVLIMNLELEVLYKVSTAISKTLDLEDMLKLILSTITRLKWFSVNTEGGIFIVEGNRLKLVSHLGHNETFLNLHKDIKVGDCLCGLAAKTGEIIVSDDCHSDIRHTITFPEMSPHGHIIVPLKSKNKVIGILYLYLPANTHVEDDKIEMLRSIGNQIGIAIENSRLFEETRALSLHDPLTGIANRRFMNIVLERSFARAKRLKRPLSIIMLDIDNFKKYNDSYGHTKGDKILVDVAHLLLQETRETDLAVRYGGEEFIILLPEADLTKASEIAERIRKAVSSDTNVTISLGVASYNQETQPEDFINKVDYVLYKAKKNGKNRVEVCF